MMRDTIYIVPALLQQHLPPAVLKLRTLYRNIISRWSVATTPTACGIETFICILYDAIDCLLQQHLPLAVLKLFFADS